MRKKTNISIFPLVIMGVFLVFASSCSKDDDNGSSSGNATTGTMTDQDGNVYKTVTIGKQTWMAENLRTTKYNDGTAISNVTGATEWASLTTGAYCNYNNTTNTDAIATYGRLYNWYAVNTGKLAPKGWHIPSNAEWSTLTNYLGGEKVAGAKLKETGTTHWISPNTGATNETGFTALPGGTRGSGGTYGFVGEYSFWGSSTQDDEGNVCLRSVVFSDREFTRWFCLKESGISIRCVRD